jgi:hypothetical protein
MSASEYCCLGSQGYLESVEPSLNRNWSDLMRRKWTVLITTLWTALGGCGRPTVTVQPPPRVTQDWGYDVDGLHVSIPQDSKGTANYRRDRTDWKLPGVTFTAQKQPDGTFKLLRNGELIGTAKAGEHVEFTADGHLLHHATAPR